MIEKFLTELMKKVRGEKIGFLILPGMIRKKEEIFAMIFKLNSKVAMVRHLLDCGAMILRPNNEFSVCHLARRQLFFPTEQGWK